MGELVLADCEVPAANRLGDEGAGLAIFSRGMEWERAVLLAPAVGAMDRLLQRTLAHVRRREQFGRPIAGFQLTQAKFADMALEVQKGFLLALHLGRRHDAVGLRPEQVSAGKLNNVREAIKIARECRTILGANGISGEYPVLRHANNLESVLTYEGTSEIHQLVLGQKLTGLNAFGG
jgi:glutaryl-CoA dehydrogenase